MHKFFQNICFLSIFLIIVAACSKSKEEGPKVITNEGALDTLAAHPDLKAPDFTLVTMKGEKFTLSDHLGKVVVLNHWATWCGPCISEIPDFIELQKEMRDQGVMFVGISGPKEGWEPVRAFAKENGINYTLVRDDGTFSKKYELGAYPTTYIINRRGEIAHKIKSSTTKELLKPSLVELSKM